VPAAERKLDSCTVSVYPSLNPDHESITLPDNSMSHVGVTAKINKDGVVISGADLIYNYEQVACPPRIILAVHILSGMAQVAINAFQTSKDDYLGFANRYSGLRGKFEICPEGLRKRGYFSSKEVCVRSGRNSNCIIRRVLTKREFVREIER